MGHLILSVMVSASVTELFLMVGKGLKTRDNTCRDSTLKVHHYIITEDYLFNPLPTLLSYSEQFSHEIEQTAKVHCCGGLQSEWNLYIPNYL